MPYRIQIKYPKDPNWKNAIGFPNPIDNEDEAAKIVQDLYALKAKLDKKTRIVEDRDIDGEPMLKEKPYGHRIPYLIRYILIGKEEKEQSIMQWRRGKK